MTTSTFDAYRPPEPPRRKRRERVGDDGVRTTGPRPGRAGGDGSREMSMVDDVEFSSYYGRPIVKAPPWKHEIAIYFVLGGIAGGSALLGAGAQLTGRRKLRRNSRLTALASIGAGAVALIADLGRPERFLNMMRTVKITSPMSLGSWLLAGFSTVAAVPAAAEVVRMTRGLILPKLIRRPARKVLRAVENPAGIAAAALGAPLAVYTAVLISDTANPVWNAGRKHLPYLFVSSASLASAGIAMITTPKRQTLPARILAVLGVGGDLVSMHLMKDAMHPAEREPLEQGEPGKLLRFAEILAVAGGVGALFAGKSRVIAVLSGAALAGASACTRFGVLEAGIESTHDPRHVIEPQKARLAERRARGVTHDSITTAG